MCQFAFSLSFVVWLYCALFGINVRRMLLDFGCALVGRSVFVVLLCRDLTSSESRVGVACDRHDMLLNSKSY